MDPNPTVEDIPAAAASESRPLRTFLRQAVREYRDKVAERIFGRPLRKPWMKYREIRIIEDLLQAVRPAQALEWGAGFGTLYFGGLLPRGSAWISIEHDQEWAERLQATHEIPAHIRVFTVPPDRPTWTPEERIGNGKGDGEPEDFQSYVEFPAAFGAFDFILIDGRARAACLRQAFSLVTDRGVVVMHDANRHFLRESWAGFPFQAEFCDYRRYSGGLWIGSKGRDIRSMLDISGHRKVWRLYNSLGKGFRL